MTRSIRRAGALLFAKYIAGGQNMTDPRQTTPDPHPWQDGQPAATRPVDQHEPLRQSVRRRLGIPGPDYRPDAPNMTPETADRVRGAGIRQPWLDTARQYTPGAAVMETWLADIQAVVANQKRESYGQGYNDGIRDAGQRITRAAETPTREPDVDALAERIRAAWGDTDERGEPHRVIMIGPIGSRNDTMIYNRNFGQIITGTVQGYNPCFCGSIGDMTVAVEAKHARGTKHSNDYLAALRFLDDVQKADRRRAEQDAVYQRAVEAGVFSPNTSPDRDTAQAPEAGRFVTGTPMLTEWAQRWGRLTAEGVLSCPDSTCGLPIGVHSEYTWRLHVGNALQQQAAEEVGVADA